MSAVGLLLFASLLTAEERRRFEDSISSHLASDFESALRGYERILDAHADFAPARLYRAEALWLLGRREDAREELARARADVLLARVLSAIFGGGRDPLVRRVVEAYPLERNRFLATGTPVLVLLSLGNLEEAIAEYRRVASLDPEDAILHRQMGSSFQGAKLYLPASEAFERVVAAAPGDVGAWRKLGSANLALQRWEPAIASLERAIEIAGEEVGVLLAVGYAYERKPDAEKALELYRRASRLAPRSARPHYRIGRALMARGRTAEAEVELEVAASLDPKMPEPLGFLGEIQWKRGKNERALATLERALAADPEYSEAYYHLAQVYRRLGRPDDAKKALALYEDLKRKKRSVLSQEEVLALR
jgi:tetratricopeptide (TPR) repeat protein